MSITGIKIVTDEIKKVAHEKIAQVKIYQLHLMAHVIDLAISRGAFKGSEASQIGALFDTLAVGINKAYEIAEEDIKKDLLQEKIALPVLAGLPEEDDEQDDDEQEEVKGNDRSKSKSKTIS